MISRFLFLILMLIPVFSYGQGVVTRPITTHKQSNQAKPRKAKPVQKITSKPTSPNTSSSTSPFNKEYTSQPNVNHHDQEAVNTIDGHEYVDLGLPSKTKWATCNIGASQPNNIGRYYAWGETYPKSSYSDMPYAYKQHLKIRATINDAATVNWSKNWCMPTDNQFRELLKYCKWTRKNNGFDIVGPNGNHMFLPFGGYKNGTHLYDEIFCNYWCVSFNIPYCYCLRNQGCVQEYAHIGMPIRPVVFSQTNQINSYPSTNTTPNRPMTNTPNEVYVQAQPTKTGKKSVKGHEYVDLGLPSKTIWAKCNIGANKEHIIGDYFAWSEVKPYEPNSKSNTKPHISIRSNPKYDAATAIWGKEWCIPTKEQLQELIIYCKWEKIQYGSHTGFKITGPNGNHIFLPFSGYKFDNQLYSTSLCYYWSSSNYNMIPFCLTNESINSQSLYVGMSIRPVLNK